LNASVFRLKDKLTKSRENQERGFFFDMRWIRKHFEHKETIVTILCEEKYIRTGEETLIQCRKTLEAYIQKDPEFGTTHAPHEPIQGADEIILRMCSESARAGVGPMASVAGTFAYESLKSMLESGAKEAVVDNGGDIVFQVREPVTVGIYAGNSQIRDLAFLITPSERPLSICTSSGTVGHSFSYGKADAAVVVSHNAVLADAAATALGNRIKSQNDLQNGFEFLEKLRDIEGAMVVCQNEVALWGRLPELIHCSMNQERITQRRDKT
jgi:ApbE superfamily uncharacterized protein (UPF0280 family)